MQKIRIQEIDLGVVRISSMKQGLAGDSPDEQKEAIQAKRKKDGREHIQIEWIEIIDSASGKDQPFQRVIEFCDKSSYKISNAYIKVMDRMTRGGAEAYILLKKQLDKRSLQLVDVAGVIDPRTVNTLEHVTKKKYPWSVYSPSYTNELLQAEKDKEEVRKILTRLISAEIRYTKMGYWNGPSPLGYKNKKIDTLEHGKRTILEPDDKKEAPWFETMFTLIAQGVLDMEIVKQVNAMGFKTRPRNIYDKVIKNKIIGKHPGEPLTVKSLREYKKRPIYAGISTHEWLEGVPIKARCKGIISIDLFNQANKGKITIVEDGEAVRIYRGKVPSYMLKKDKFNENFPYKDQVLCPHDREEFYASTSKGGHGGYYPAYHHGSKGGKHKYFKIPSKTFHDKIEEFVKDVKFTDDFLMYLHKYILEEWEIRRKTTLGVNASLSERLATIEREQEMYAEKIPTLNSPATIRIFEDKIEALEQEKLGVMAEKAKKQKEGLDIQKIINHSWYFFEHVEELILGGTDKRTNATLFALIFDEKPTYDEMILRTAKLACAFELNERYKQTRGLKNMNSDPSSPQFEPELTWLENLRRIYEETDDQTQGGENV